VENEGNIKKDARQFAPRKFVKRRENFEQNQEKREDFSQSVEFVQSKTGKNGGVYEAEVEGKSPKNQGNYSKSQENGQSGQPGRRNDFGQNNQSKNLGQNRSNQNRFDSKKFGQKRENISENGQEIIQNFEENLNNSNKNGTKNSAQNNFVKNSKNFKNIRENGQKNGDFSVENSEKIGNSEKNGQNLDQNSQQKSQIQQNSQNIAKNHEKTGQNRRQNFGKNQEKFSDQEQNKDQNHQKSRQSNLDQLRLEPKSFEPKNFPKHSKNTRENGRVYDAEPVSKEVQNSVKEIDLDFGNKTIVSESKNGVLRMVAISGTEEIGMNMMLYSYEYKNGKKYTILVDCGISFADLPGANVIMPNLYLLKQNGVKIDAVLLTHGHEDHIGAIPYVYDCLKVPMYATPFTHGLIDRKMKFIKKKDYLLEMVKCGETRNFGPFKVKWIATAHSIPDSAMLAIEVEGIRVVHTGDWKVDPNPVVGSVIDHQSLIEFGKKGVHALVADSTNIHETETSNSEGDVARSLKELVKNTKTGRFILTCFSSNIARVHSCIEAAKEAGRKVLVLGSSLKRSIEVATELGYVNDDWFVDEDEASQMSPSDLMIISTGSQGEENSALWKMANKMRTAGSVIEKGDTIVFSARVIDGRQHNVRAIINQLVERGVRVLHPWNSKSSCIHASGHPAQPDIAHLFDWVRPKCVIPVHSEAEHRISHIAFAKSKGYKTFNLKNGVVISIGDEIQKLGILHCQRMAYDGNRLIGYESEVFKQRRTLNDNGVIVVSVGMKGRKPSCVVTSYGVYDKDADINHKKALTYSKQLKIDIERVLAGFASSDLTSQENIIRKKVNEVIRNAVWLQIKKNPIISCHIVS